jgi:hypothetical protein
MNEPTSDTPSSPARPAASFPKRTFWLGFAPAVLIAVIGSAIALSGEEVGLNALAVGLFVLLRGAALFLAGVILALIPRTRNTGLALLLASGGALLLSLMTCGAFG